jgi:hypothetical protein
MTPNEEYSKEFWAIQKEREALEKRRQKMHKKLKDAQKVCPHPKWEGGFMFSECIRCGLTDL